MKQVVALQHVAPETLGAIEPALQAQNVAVEVVKTFEDQAVPDSLDAWDGLILMGGPMGVYEHATYPHLRQERLLIQRALDAGKPILGVCLGSQLLASAVGAEVAPGPRQEIGWYDVALQEEAHQDPLCYDLPERFSPLHWHGDQYALPEGAVALAASNITPCQAFRYRDNAYGFLFHLEVTLDMIKQWTQAFAHELEGNEQSAEAIVEMAEHRIDGLHKLAENVFSKWAALV